MTEKINPLLLSSEIGDEYHKDVAAPDTKTMRFATHVNLKTFENRSQRGYLRYIGNKWRNFGKGIKLVVKWCYA